MISVVVIALLAVAVDFTQSAHFHLAVPRHPHYDTQYMATVTAVGVQNTESVRLTYRGNRHTREELNTTTLTFQRDGIKTWGVVFPWERMQKLNEYAVRLELTSVHNNLAITSRTLSFSTSSGYIFIQTDKPVYTPRQTVKFRILAVDEYLRLARHQLKVDIMNQKHVIVDRMHYSAEDAFKGQEFELPRETPPGQWSITANYEGLDHSHGTTHTVNFEVKEYVLPRFYAAVSVDKDVITKDDDWVSILVKASYVYGRPVQGWMDMKLGVWGSRTGLDQVFLNYSQPLKKGRLLKHVRISTLFNNHTTFRDSKRLYVAVNITETGTQEVDSIVDTSTFIAHPFYDVTFKDCRTFFKPGFPYTLHIQVRAKNGRPASWVEININGTAYRDDGSPTRVVMKTLKLDDKGEASYEVNLAENAVSVDFQVTVLDVAHIQVERLTVRRHSSTQRDFIHIAMQTAVTKRTDGVVLLRYTSPSTWQFDLDQPPERITLLVTARGHVVHTTSTVRNTDGRSQVKIPARMATELTPSMRIVAFFQSPAGGELIIDSLWVDTPDMCLEELNLHPLGGSIFGSSEMVKPKEPYTMEIHGGAYMKVGLVAVDKAVFQIRDKGTLTRESMFDQLGKRDRGVDTNDGEDVAEVFKDSGLQHMSIDTSVNMMTANFDSLLSNSHLPRLGVDYYSSFSQNHQYARKDEGPRGPLDGLPPLGVSESELGEIIPIHIPEAPPQTVRKYFPESWLFQEQELPRSGQLNLNMTMPDSITTWSFLAVGLSINRGVCVSKPMEQSVQKVFFADLRMPYKVTRLEEIKLRLAIYNYQSYELPVYGRVSGVSGTNDLCFPALEDAGQWGLNHTAFTLKVPKGGTANYVFPVIPLRDGEVTIRVDLFHERVRDVLEKKLFVVAEGRRVRKYITFVLDPGAKHATYKRSRRNKIFLSKTTAVKNVIDLRRKVQQTTIDLALPQETIRGTEHCRISAFGDLMGDVITHAVMESRSLMDQPTLDAEEVIGDLGPTVHALLYANQSGLMNEELSRKGRRFVRHAVARLLKYHDGSSFRLTADSKPGTWLTAVVLRTLCHASSLAFIDRTNLIDAGFGWLLSQVTDNDTLHEQDWRLADDSFEYRVMLAAEVLIALLECGSSDHEERLTLETHMAFFLEDNIGVVREPMVLAKLTYALTLFEPKGDATLLAARKLLGHRRKNKLNQIYWADQPENTESRKVPFWYHRGTKASSVEATAFALKVFMVHNGANVDAIADWLVAQRGSSGAFIGALDSLAAIQALSAYSLRKHGLDEVDLQCKVSSDRLKHYRYSFNFTEEDATRVKSVNDVPVGHALKVATKGRGLGQMQVSVEYNIPIEKNARCQFHVTVEVKETQVRGMPDMFSNPLCTWCNIGCVEIPPTNATDNETNNNATSTSNIPASARSKETPDPPLILHDIMGQIKMRPHGRTRSRSSKNSRIGPPPPGPASGTCQGRRCLYKTRGRRRNPRKSRRPRAASSSHPASSKKSICIQVCLQHKQDEWAGPTVLEIEMLTGYTPVTTDVNRIKADNPNVRAVEFLVETEVLLVHFIRVPFNESTCVSLRAVDDEEVGHPTPANVLVKPAGQQYTSCALEYKSVHGQESLQVYCADINHSNKGECRCSSGLCGSCHPYTHDEIGISETREMVCQADIAYQLIIEKFQDNSQWYEIDARVLSVNKTGSHHLRRGDIVKLRTPNSCRCPIWAFGERTDAFYMLAPDVEKLRDRFGNPVYHYVVDDRSRVLRVSDPGQSSASSTKPAVQFEYLQYVLRTSHNKC